MQNKVKLLSSNNRSIRILKIQNKVFANGANIVLILKVMANEERRLGLPLTKSKEIYEKTRWLRSQILIFDTPIKRAVFKAPPPAQDQGPRPEQRRRGPLFGGHIPPME